MDNATVFFTKTTNRELYQYRNIIEMKDDKFVFSNPISEENIKEMRNNMNVADVDGFDEILEKLWGIKKPKPLDFEEVVEEVIL